MKIRTIIPSAFCLLICGLLLPPKLAALQTNTPSELAETMGQTTATSNTIPSTATNLAGANPVITNLTATNQAASVHSWNNPQPIVLFGQNAELKAGDSAETVVVIGGSAAIHGRVREAVVVIGGNAEVDGNVGEAVVAIFGNVHLKPGAVVREDVVSVLGTVTADPGVKVNGNTVAVGGKLDLANGATVKGDKVNVGFPKPFANVEWLRNWFKYCVFELRPLAFQVGFVWVIGAVFFLIYLFIAAVFARPVQASVEDLDRRPATIFLVGLLTKLIVPCIYLILLATGLGVAAVPLIGVTLFFFALFGKVALLEWLGFKAGHLFGGGIQKPLAAFILGILMVTLVYLVPILGLLAYVILGIWGLGSGVMAVFGRARREAPEAPVTTPSPSSVQPVAPTAPPVIDESTPPSADTGTTSAAAGGSGPVPPGVSQSQPTAGAAPAAVDMTSFPKATLWERLLAAVLDITLIGLFAGFTHLGRYSLIVALVYFTAMWLWRGTTIGGILLKLKVVPTDGRQLTFGVALVRGLAATFSAIILFLGFLWIAWDKDKQGWHDKIAGTIVVRLPHSAPLVLL